MLARILLTGAPISPDMYDTIMVLGWDECIERLSMY